MFVRAELSMAIVCRESVNDESNDFIFLISFKTWIEGEIVFMMFGGSTATVESCAKRLMVKRRTINKSIFFIKISYLYYLLHMLQLICTTEYLRTRGEAILKL